MSRPANGSILSIQLQHSNERKRYDGVVLMTLSLSPFQGKTKVLLVIGLLLIWLHLFDQHREGISIHHKKKKKKKSIFDNGKQPFVKD
jgi:hypothetical protein